VDLFPYFREGKEELLDVKKIKFGEAKK